MRTLSQVHVDRNVASRALIDLVADVAWAERAHAGPAQLQRMRDEAMTLLSKVERGDADAARRAIELTDVAGDVRGGDPSPSADLERSSR